MRQTALHEAEILHLVVQKCETKRERGQDECELKRLCSEKALFMDATVARGFMSRDVPRLW